MQHLLSLPLERKASFMIRSMTGFGRRQTAWQDGSVTVEVRSVNHRFLEVACRLPRSLNHLEEMFKKAVQQRCTRGRIDLPFLYKEGRAEPRPSVLTNPWQSSTIKLFAPLRNP